VILSKDSDFRQLVLFGPPPKVVWLRVGNASTSVTVSLLRDNIDVLAAFAAGGDDALLLLPRL